LSSWSDAPSERVSGGLAGEPVVLVVRPPPIDSLSQAPNGWKSTCGAAVHIVVACGSHSGRSSCSSLPLGSASSRSRMSNPVVLRSAPTSPVVTLPQASPSGKSCSGGSAPDVAAALPSGGSLAHPEPSSRELAVWVVLLILDGPTRHSRGPAAELSHNHAAPKTGVNDRDETTSARRQRFDSRTQYLNTAKDNLEFPSQPFAGFGAITFPRDNPGGRSSTSLPQRRGELQISWPAPPRVLPFTPRLACGFEPRQAPK